MDYTATRKHMYSLAHSIGKNGLEQHALVDALHKIEMLPEEDSYKVLAMVSLFYDGLAYGSWPWNRGTE